MTSERKIRTVAVSGFFDCVHKGHVELMKKAKALGEYLIVILNTDEQCIKKKGYVFMTWADRKIILESFSFVDRVVPSIDKDQTVCKTLELWKPDIFANGGDRNNKEIPEVLTCAQLGIKIVDGLGAKIASSSELVKNSKGKQNDN